MAQVVTTVLVDANELFREGLRRALANTRFRVKRVVGLLDEVRSGSGLVLVGTTGSVGSLTLDISRFRAANPDTRLVVLGDNCEREDIPRVFRAGANGYLSKQATCETLTKSLELVMLGASVLSPEATRQIFGSNEIRREAIRAEGLTPGDDRRLENQRSLSEREMSILHCLNPGQPYLPNWHISAIAYQLDRVRRGEINRLIINMPPRHLKSLTVSVAFPAFLLGHEPGHRIFAISYGSDLSSKDASDFRSIVEAPWYLSLLKIIPANSNDAVPTEQAQQ
jgi:DNA-binding NarL/FixJ family response regulator